MANLEETAKWEEGVYQWETDDPVVGGPDGIDNVPTRQLANRTGYLKTQIEAHAAATDPHPQYLQQSEGDALYDKTGAAAALMTGHMAAGDPHPQYLLQAEGDQLYDKAGTAASVLQAHGNAADPHPQYTTNLEVNAAIDTRVPQLTVTADHDPTFADISTKPASTSWVRGAIAGIATVAGFSYSFANNGYVKFPGWLAGLVIQWGGLSIATGNGDIVAFPLAFPNAVLAVVASDFGNGCNPVAAMLNGTKTGFSAYGKNPSTGAYAPTDYRWLAVGY
jgi:hypothetical protein